MGEGRVGVYYLRLTLPWPLPSREGKFFSDLNHQSIPCSDCLFENFSRVLLRFPAGGGVRVAAGVKMGENQFFCSALRGNGGGQTIYRLREGVERFLITDLNNAGASAKGQSEVPVMWDATQGLRKDGNGQFNHIPGGANALYMDGHVEFIRYPSESIPCSPLMVAMGGVW